ncbi:hypothetical protein BZA70DRAFT_273174 [Myxozyma melibiosi]|uniref:USP domain-containing protein n=1 Tax=Myxozyma melibiosi TaxID=54550 RepID=A0ABR1FED5_9ASCO
MSHSHDHRALIYAGLATVASLALYALLPSFMTNSDDSDDFYFSETSDNPLAGFSRNSRYVVGLLNSSNDCFANSDLQALASSPTLRAYLKNPEVQNEPLTAALRKIIEELNTPLRRPKAISPWPFLHVLEYVFKRRITRQQHDAHELLHLILETITDEHEKALKELSDDSSQEKESDKKTSSTAPVKRKLMPFEGTTVDVIECQFCGHRSTPKTTNFLVLTLNVPQTWSATLDECLSSVLLRETISDYGCQSCRLKVLIDSISRSLARKGMTAGESTSAAPADGSDPPNFNTDPAGYLQYLKALDPSSDLHPTIEAALPREIKSTITRTTTFGHLPDVLILHLSRSIYSSVTATRNNCRVQFPEFLTQRSGQPKAPRLDLLATSLGAEDEDASEAVEKTYRLVAVVRHLGTHSAGHYECYRRKEMFKDYFARAREDSAFEEKLAVENHSNISTPDEVEHVSPTTSESSGLFAATPDEDSIPDQQHPAQTRHRGKHRRRELGARAARKLYRQFTGPKGWWRISDDSVWEVSVDEVLRQAQNAYLLVYERVSPEEVTELKARGKL